MPASTVTNPVLHHVNLKTTRLQEMIDWYAQTIGMRVNYQWPGGAFLTNDAANHRLAMLAVPGLEEDPDKIRHTGLHHTAYEYPSMDDLLGTLSEPPPSSPATRLGSRLTPTNSSPRETRAQPLRTSTAARTPASSYRTSPSISVCRSSRTVRRSRAGLSLSARDLRWARRS
jgi:hypothetical protein